MKLRFAAATSIPGVSLSGMFGRWSAELRQQAAWGFLRPRLAFRRSSSRGLSGLLSTASRLCSSHEQLCATPGTKAMLCEITYIAEWNAAPRCSPRYRQQRRQWTVALLLTIMSGRHSYASPERKRLQVIRTHGDRSLYGDQTACFRIPNITVLRQRASGFRRSAPQFLI